MKMYWDDAEIGEYDSLTEAAKAIYRSLEDIDYKPHYIRMWREGTNVHFDYGSWSKFFVIKNVDDETWYNYMNGGT